MCNDLRYRVFIWVFLCGLACIRVPAALCVFALDPLPITAMTQVYRNKT
jgi:hypothetical protein